MQTSEHRRHLAMQAVARHLKDWPKEASDVLLIGELEKKAYQLAREGDFASAKRLFIAVADLQISA